MGASIDEDAPRGGHLGHPAPELEIGRYYIKLLVALRPAAGHRHVNRTGEVAVEALHLALGPDVTPLCHAKLRQLTWTRFLNYFVRGRAFD